MANLEYSLTLAGFVPFGTLAFATVNDLVIPTFEDALFIRESGTLTLTANITGQSLTIGDDTPGATGHPIVILAPGTVFSTPITVRTGGTLQLGPALADANANNPAVLNGALTITAAGIVNVTAGTFGGDISAAGPLNILGTAIIVAAITFPGAPQLTSTATSTLALLADLPTATLLAILAAPAFAGAPAFAFAGAMTYGGHLDNTGATINTALLPNLVFANATIAGGTLLADPTTLFTGNTLNGVHLAGTLITPSGEYNTATGTIDGGGTLDVQGFFGFGGITYFDNTTILLGPGASVYEASSSATITFAAASTVEITDAAMLNFPSLGAKIRLDGLLNLADSVSPYSVTFAASQGTLELGPTGILRIGANASLTLNAGIFTNGGTIAMAGGTIEFVTAANKNNLGILRFTGDGAVLRLDTLGQTATLRNFNDGQRIFFPTASKTNAHAVLTGNTLDIISGATPKLDAHFILERNDTSHYSIDDFVFSTTGIGLSVTTRGVAISACYAQGTRIETATGQRPIETLQPGDRVRTLSGALVPITWIGHRHIDLRHHPRPHDINPVRVRAHAFGPNLPARDLILSPDHAIHAEAVLVPIRYLLNGATIIQEAPPHITYFHLELAHHDIILAENLPAESYLDTGNRSAFANAASTTQLHPDFALKIWEAKSCAPLATTGDTITLIRHSLLAQAQSLGHHLTDNPATTVTTTPTRTTITSRSFTPAHINPTSTDHRRLGLAITSITADGHNIPLNHPSLTTGWHPPEPTHRWTTGHATIALPATVITIETILATPTYWQENRADKHSSIRYYK